MDTNREVATPTTEIETGGPGPDPDLEDEGGPRFLLGRLAWSKDDGLKQVLDFPRPRDLATVDVIMSVRDVRPIFLHKALWSVHRQTYPHIDRILVTDDGSTNPQTAELLRAWRDKGWVSKLYVNPVNRGIGASWNRMIRDCRSEYIFIMGADDMLMPTYLAEVINALEMLGSVDIMATYCYIVDEEDKLIRKWNVGAAGVYKRSIFTTRDLWFDETRRSQVDSELQERLMEKGGIIRAGAEPLYLYRWHESNVTGRAAEIRALKTKKDLRETTGNPVLVVSPGCPLHGQSAAQQLQADFATPETELTDYRLIYFVGNFIVPAEATISMLETLKADADRVLFMHWVGTDISIWAGETEWKVTEKDLAKLKVFVDHHFCEGPETQAELHAKLGIEAEVLPVPVRKILKPLPLPETFRVHCYIPKGRGEHFNYKFWREVQEETGFEFVWVDGSLSHEDSIAQLTRCAVAVRNTVHDGDVPITLAEAKMLGRYAVYNRKLMHCTFAQSKEQAIRALRKFSTYRPSQFDQAGSRYYRDYFSRKNYRDKFYLNVNRYLRLMKEHKLRSQEEEEE